MKMLHSRILITLETQLIKDKVFPNKCDYPPQTDRFLGKQFWLADADFSNDKVDLYIPWLLDIQISLLKTENLFFSVLF